MGRSLLRDSVAPYSYHETGKDQLETGVVKYMIISYQDTTIYKYIYTAGFKKEELYNITTDPGEKNNLVKSNKEIVVIMRKKAAAYTR
jgi:hypothetical protein